jgi:hypothetical protein
LGSSVWTLKSCVPDFSDGGEVSGNMITWTITRAVGESTEVLPVSFNLIPRTASTGNELMLSNTLDDNTVTSTYSFGALEGGPSAIIAPATSVTERTNLLIDGSASFDPNADEITFNWVQLAGTPVSFGASGDTITFEAPKVSKDETLSFQLTVEDSNGNSDTAVVSVTVANKKSSGGSFGWLMLLLTPMLWVRRKKA